MKSATVLIKLIMLVILLQLMIYVHLLSKPCPITLSGASFQTTNNTLLNTSSLQENLSHKATL